MAASMISPSPLYPSLSPHHDVFPISCGRTVSHVKSSPPSVIASLEEIQMLRIPSQLSGRSPYHFSPPQPPVLFVG